MDARVANMCMNNGLAVVYDGRRYKRINAIIWRKYTAGEEESTGKCVQAELYDGESNAVVIADVEALSFLSTQELDAVRSTVNIDPAEVDDTDETAG